MLHRAYEQLIVQAALDPAFSAHLIADPRRSALEAGCSPLLAESLVGLRSGALADFAGALHERIYGYPQAHPAAVHQQFGDLPQADTLRHGITSYSGSVRSSQAHLA